MARKHSGRASKGSQFHLQNLVNSNSEQLNNLILSISPSLRTYAAANPIWVSPLASKDYLEYQDEQFLGAIGFSQLASELSHFWPKRGPVWDALAMVDGKDRSRGVLLLEAKSHIPELGSPSSACGAKGKSLERILNTFNVVKQSLGVNPEADWTGDFYQYANRLAHLYFLYSVCRVPTWMVFLYFVGDVEQNGPLTTAEWADALDHLKKTLGLPDRHPLDERIVSVFAPVTPTRSRHI